MGERVNRPSERLVRISARTGSRVAEGQSGTATESKPDGAVFEAAGRASEFRDHVRTHYRETRRTAVHIPAQVRLLLEDGTVYDVGTAAVKNVSPSGALLADVALPLRAYPTAAFKLEILMLSGQYAGIGLEAVPVRFEPQHRGIGVRYTEIFVAADRGP